MTVGEWGLPTAGEPVGVAAAYTRTLRAAIRRGNDPFRASDEFFAGVTDPVQLHGLLEQVMTTGSTDLRDAVVFSARRLPEPAGDFLKRVVADATQPGVVRLGAAESLAQREQAGWEALVADTLLTHGRNPSQRLAGALVLANYGTGSETAPMLDYLTYVLTRPRRQGSWPSPLTAACVYFMKGGAAHPPPGFTELIERQRASLRQDETEWLLSYLPGIYRDASPAWDEMAARWARENPRDAITDLAPRRSTGKTGE
jgi:hypothetical protein